MKLPKTNKKRFNFKLSFLKNKSLLQLLYPDFTDKKKIPTETEELNINCTIKVQMCADKLESNVAQRNLQH